MKEFKKWWKNYVCDLPIGCGNLTCHNCKIIREQTWKEALEWALKRCPANSNDALVVMGDMKGELNDE